MKYTKIFEHFLFEIGDRSAKPYKYKLNGKFKDLNTLGNRLYATFKTDSNLEYTLTLININKFIDVDFSIGGEWPETNKGEMFKVMSTISEVIDNVLRTNDDIKGLRYEPKSKSTDTGEGRDRLYRIFINNSVKSIGKNANFVQQGGTVFVIID